MKPIQESTLIIIPTYNEVENVTPLAQAVLQLHPKVTLLFVDDNSPDGTQNKIHSLQEQFPDRIHLITRSGKLGLGSAYVAGFKWGIERKFGYLIEMDADFSHDPKYLSAMFDHIPSFDFVVGSRWVAGGGTRNWSLLRRMISLFGSFYARTVLGLKLRDLTGGFNAWKQETLLAINLDSIESEGYSFQIELKYRAINKGCQGIEIPIVFEDRRVGQSKMSSGIILEAIWKVWRLKASVTKSSS